MSCGWPLGACCRQPESLSCGEVVVRMTREDGCHRVVCLAIIQRSQAVACSDAVDVARNWASTHL